MDQFSTPQKTPIRSVLKEINANEFVVSFIVKPKNQLFSIANTFHLDRINLTSKFLCKNIAIYKIEYSWEVYKLTDLYIRLRLLCKYRLIFVQFWMFDNRFKAIWARMTETFFCYIFSLVCRIYIVSTFMWSIVRFDCTGWNWTWFLWQMPVSATHIHV